MKQTLTQRVEDIEEHLDSIEKSLIRLNKDVWRQPYTAMRSTGEVIMKNGDITPDGYTVVFISEYFWNLIEKDMKKIMRSPREPIDAYRSFMALRDEPAMIEFHKLKK